MYSENVWEFILICDRTLTNLEVDSMKLLTPPPNALWIILICDRTLTNLEVDSMKLLTPPPNALWIFMESLPQCTISLAKF